MGKTLEAKDAVEIADIGFRFGQVVTEARRFPMDVVQLHQLLIRMKPYREVFASHVDGSREELNKIHPMPDGSPRFNYEIPK
jgi:hypothetical protein